MSDVTTGRWVAVEVAVEAGPFPTLSEACDWVVDNHKEEVNA
jgi:hypothetical protein